MLSGGSGHYRTTRRNKQQDPSTLHQATNLIGGHITAALEGRKGELVSLNEGAAK